MRKLRRNSQTTTSLDALVGHVADLKNSHNLGNLPSHAVSKVIAMESLDASVGRELEESLTGLGTALEGIVASLDQNDLHRQIAGPNDKDLVRLTDAQYIAALESAIVTQDVPAYLQRDLRGRSAPLSAGDRFYPAADPTAVDRRISLEAYDERDNRNAAVYTTVYNLLASRQEPVAELFFPTIVVGQDQMGLTMSVRLVEVMDEYRHKMDASTSKNMGRKNLIQALKDPTILRRDTTKIVPVYDAAYDTVFVDAAIMPPVSIQYEGQTIPTSALAVGKKFQLLNISQTEALLETGVLDSTDALDASVSLQSAILQIGATGDEEAIELTAVASMVGSQFVWAQQDRERTMVLNFTTSTIGVDKTTKTVAGTAAAGLATIPDDHKVMLGFDMNGRISLDTSDTSVTAADVVVLAVYDATGTSLDLTAGTGATVKALFDDAKIIGYRLDARRINANRRERGQLLDINKFNVIYGVPVLSPITALRPVNSDGMTDTSDLAALISATRIRMSNAAIAEMWKKAGELKEYVGSNPAGIDTNNNEAFGIGGKFIERPFYEEFDLDMELAVDSIKSSERLQDVNAALVSVIRDMCYRAVQQTGYQSALDATNGGVPTKPCLLVATDQRIGAYLMTSGDMRTLGEHYDIQIAITQNNQFAGKIFMSFGRRGTEGVADPLHFGMAAWRSEITTVLNLTRNGSYSKELSVNPSYRHVVNLPIVMVVNVTNLEEVTSNKIVIHTGP